MKNFSLLLISILFFILSGCNSSKSAVEHEVRSCPECNMKLADSNKHSATITTGSNIEYFDDIGCMVLWAKDKGLDFKDVDAKVFSNDTNNYINAFDLHYKTGEDTPMSYGFYAYQNTNEESIDFNEVVVKMLRGEHMANPKIRKQILGLNNEQ